MKIIQVNVEKEKDLDVIGLSNKYMEILKEVRSSLRQHLINQNPEKTA